MTATSTLFYSQLYIMALALIFLPLFCGGGDGSGEKLICFKSLLCLEFYVLLEKGVIPEAPFPSGFLNYLTSVLVLSAAASGICDQEGLLLLK